MTAPTATRRRARAKEPWRPLTPDRLRTGVVLAFDQTIRNTGWCMVTRDAVSAVVVASGTCRTRPAGLKGWAETLAGAEAVCDKIAGVLDAYRWYDGVEVVHEAPPTGGGRLARPESTLLAALGVRRAAAAVGLPVTMLANQSAKRLLVDCVDGRVEPGPGQVKIGDVTKAMVAEALRGLTWLYDRERLGNEHERDAGALALLHLTKERP